MKSIKDFHIPDPDDAVMPISHKCCICDKFEYPKSKLIYNETWLCPECVKRIRYLIYSCEAIHVADRTPTIIEAEKESI